MTLAKSSVGKTHNLFLDAWETPLAPNISFLVRTFMNYFMPHLPARVGAPWDKDRCTMWPVYSENGYLWAPLRSLACAWHGGAKPSRPSP